MPASAGIYIGSPSIAVLPNGDYLAVHDEFGPKSGYTRVAVSKVFSSPDRGKSWSPVSQINNGALWSTLFVHRSELYLLGTTKEYGSLVIRKSADGGRTWTEPTNKNSGLLAEGRWHTAPVPLVEHTGRLWRAVEDAEGSGGWGSMYRARVMSIPVDADLLRAENWIISEPLTRDPAWLNHQFVGFLEGNVVVGPDGKLVNVLRVAAGKQQSGIAAIVHVGDDGKQLVFDSLKDFTANFPGGDKKFTIRFDPETKLYWTLGNIVLSEFKEAENHGDVRNAQVLMCSRDLRNWDVRTVLLFHPEWRKHGFQYLDWLFEGNDLIAVSRTAFDDGLGGAHRAHDANFLTFHRIENFRKLTMKDSVHISP